MNGEPHRQPYSIEVQGAARFFIRVPEQAIGGMVVSGLNWQASKDRLRKLPEQVDEIADGELRTESFLLPRPTSRDDVDPLRETVSKWINLWGGDLAPGNEWDRAILPTNLFYNMTFGCNWRMFESRCWYRAARRLIEGAAHYKASGILISGMSALGGVSGYLEGCNGCEAAEPEFKWAVRRPGLMIGYLPRRQMSIAMIYHYAYRRLRHPGNGEDSYVESIREDMKRWLRAVWDSYQCNRRAP